MRHSPRFFCLIAFAAVASCQLAPPPGPVVPTRIAPAEPARAAQVSPDPAKSEPAARQEATPSSSDGALTPAATGQVPAPASAPAPGSLKAPQTLSDELARRLAEASGASAKFWGVRGSYDGQIVVRYNEKIWSMPDNFDIDLISAVASSHSDGYELYSPGHYKLYDHPYNGPLYLHHYGNANGYLFANDTGTINRSLWYPLWATTRHGDNNFPVVITLVRNNGEEYPLAIAASTGTANNDGAFYDWYWTAGLEAKGRDLRGIFEKGTAAYKSSVEWTLYGLGSGFNKFGNQAFYDALRDRLGWPLSYQAADDYKPQTNLMSAYYYYPGDEAYRFPSNVTYYPNRYHGLIPSGTTMHNGFWSYYTPLPNGTVHGMGTASGYMLDFSGKRRTDYGMRFATYWGYSSPALKFPYPYTTAVDNQNAYGKDHWNHVGWIANLFTGPANQGSRLNEAKPIMRQTEEGFVHAIKSGELELPEHLPRRAVTSLVFKGSAPENFQDLGNGRVYYKVPADEVLVLNYFEQSIGINGFTIRPTAPGVHNGGNFVFGPGEEVVFSMIACDSISGFTVSPDLLRGVWSPAGAPK